MKPAFTARRAARSIAIKLGIFNIVMKGDMVRICAKHGTKLAFVKNSVDLLRGNRVIRLSMRHLIYAPTISANFDVYFSPVVSETVGEHQIVDYSMPRRHRYVRSGLEFELSAFPEEDEVIEEYFRWYTPKPGELVFDFGAHCGLSTYYLSKSVGPEGKVVAFEPDKLAYSTLLKNIDLHDLRNVTPVEGAISDLDGTATFYSEGTIGSTLKSASNRPTIGTAYQVETITIATACKRYGVPAFIKMDIEGAELTALPAARQTLLSESIAFAIDTNHPTDGVTTDKAIEQVFRECGYISESIIAQGIVTTYGKKTGSSVASHPNTDR
jgi:FkbM family methyltransferase